MLKDLLSELKNGRSYKGLPTIYTKQHDYEGNVESYDVVYASNGVEVYKGYYALGIRFDDKSWLEIFREYYLQLSQSLQGIGCAGSSDLIKLYNLTILSKYVNNKENLPEKVRVCAVTKIVNKMVDLACMFNNNYKRVLEEEPEIIELFCLSVLEY